MILVERSRLYGGSKGLPDPGGVGAGGQRMRGGIPTVEIAHDRDTRGVRRPDRKMSAQLPAGAGLHRMGPELLVGTHVCAFAKEIDVLIGEQHSASLAITMPGCPNQL